MEGAVHPRRYTLELRSRTLPPIMTDHANPPAPSSLSVTCTGLPRLRDPKVFSGADETDVEDWLDHYELVSAHNKWDDPDKLGYVIFYLTGVAELWYNNHKQNIPTWTVFKTSCSEVFGRPAVRKQRAEQRLRVRSQQTGESFTSYIEDVVDLCRRVNDTMPEADRIKQILKGIDDGAFQMLLARNPGTVSEVVSLCQSYDELKKQRALTRQPPRGGESLCSLDTMPDHSTLLQQVRDFVREEVARQLSLLPFTHEPTTRLPTPLRTVISEEVAHAVPLARREPPPSSPVHYARASEPVAAPVAYAQAVQPVAAPLTYADVLRRLPQPPYTTHSQPTQPPVYPSTWAAPTIANPWRTPDNRPICYACYTPGHVARYCRRRPQTFGDRARSSQAGSQPFLQYVPGPSPRDAPTHRPDFQPQRSPSPRRRSPSPMRRRPGPSDQEN